MTWIAELPIPTYAQALLGLGVVVLVALVIHLVARPLVLRITKAIVDRTPMQWDGVIFESRVPHRLSLFVPLGVLRVGLEVVPGLSQGWTTFFERLIGATSILLVGLTIGAIMTALHSFYNRLPIAATRPIKSYVQLAKLFVYTLVGVFIIARLGGLSPWFFVSGLGAMMAIITLVFRDTILSLVAGVQLTSNDLIRVGDWIEMPNFDADGDVVDIALNTVTVINWDKTVTIVPTHKFLDNSFKNWRSMFEGGGRRIKRSIHINTSTIRFLTDEEIDRFGRFALLKDYIATKVAELEEANKAHSEGDTLVVNQRRLTNIGTLRAYMVAYLRQHPKIHQEMTFLVRQIEPTPEGLPLEVYVFVNDTRWAFYEEVQADVFDHFFAIIPEFGLQVYQRPSGADFAMAAAEEGAPFRLMPGAPAGDPMLTPGD